LCTTEERYPAENSSPAAAKPLILDFAYRISNVHIDHCHLPISDLDSHTIDMKTDYYLNLCLEQAAQSPLRYRHGCIIVRGGKVIGQGFNDHRAGFDGGALKTGRLPARSLNSAALAELKRKHKHKRGSTNPSEEVAKTFTPFEAMGGGKLANSPLSMHSEMMAIHSALSACTTLVSTAVSCKKPYSKLSGDSKRKCRLRQDAIKTYVETISKVALAQSTEQRFARPVGEWRFEGAAPQSDLLDRGAGSDERPCVSGAYGEQSGETAGEETEEPSTGEKSSREQWTAQATAQAVCA
jgi:deoxycytidylate deaminase